MQFIFGETEGDVTSHLAAEWNLFLSAEGGDPIETLRIWEASKSTIVLGRNRLEDHDVIDAACRADGVQLVRRQTGGGTVVVGYGCLNYALLLSLIERPALADVAVSLERILQRITRALDVPDLAFAGQADLVLGGRKVSGNAQRRGRRALLHHGTLLYAFDPALAARYLKEPARRPAYRGHRRHLDFLTNLSLSSDEIIARLRTAWSC
jgi:lipoate---protein ligase